MTPDEIEALLPELVMGTLPELDRAVVEVELAISTRLRRERDRVAEALASLAAALPAAEPSRATRARLLATVAGPERFAPFVDQLAGIFDLDAGAVRRVLGAVDDPAVWSIGYPGVRYLDFAPGPRLTGASAGVVRLGAGCAFPRHRHVGREVIVVVEGTLLDGGRHHHPGAVVEHAPGTIHRCVAGPARDLVTLNLHHGIQPV